LDGRLLRSKALLTLGDKRNDGIIDSVSKGNLDYSNDLLLKDQPVSLEEPGGDALFQITLSKKATLDKLQALASSLIFLNTMAAGEEWC
jgi:hypothetical protein